jgi:hypothetical protein
MIYYDVESFLTLERRIALLLARKHHFGGLFLQLYNEFKFEVISLSDHLHQRKILPQ